jgi:hypothetical protein
LCHGYRIVPVSDVEFSSETTRPLWPRPMARENQKQEGSLLGVKLYLAVLSTASVQYVACESAADMCV